MTPPTPETLLTPDGVEAGVAARLTAYTRGQRRGPLTGDVYLWAYSAALAGWRTSELRLAEAERARRTAEVAAGVYRNSDAALRTQLAEAENKCRRLEARLRGADTT